MTRLALLALAVPVAAAVWAGAVTAALNALGKSVLGNG